MVAREIFDEEESLLDGLKVPHESEHDLRHPTE
jgi:hypothetical protein